MLIDVKDQGLFLKALIYGSFGSGKTHLACSSALHPMMSPVLLIDVEGGTISTESKNIRKTPVVQKIEDIEDIFWQVASKDGEYSTFKTIILDSGSSLQDMVLLSYLNESKNKAGLEQGHYNMCRLKMVGLINKFTQLDINFIMTATERVEYPLDSNGKEDKKKGPSIICPGFSPSLGRDMSHKFSYVWRILQLDNNDRNMNTTKINPIKAKTRGANFLNALGPVVKNPTMPSLFNLLQETEGNKNV